MSTPFPKNNSVQIAENSILDFFNKQTYLGNSFSLGSGTITFGDTLENPKVLITNSSQKGFFFYFRNAGSSAQFYARFYANPTVTVNGTPATPVNLRPAYQTASVASCYTGPTISGNGSLITNMSCANALVQSSLMFIIDPGTKLLVTAQAPGGTGTAYIEMAWYEL